MSNGDQRRRRHPPQTLTGAILRGLFGVAIGTVVLAAFALLVAHLADRPLGVALYLVAGVAILSGVVAASADREYAALVNEFRPRVGTGAILFAVGFVTIGLAVLVETFG